VKDLPSDWPKDGCVRFVDVTLKYDPEDDPVITGADFCISPGEKVKLREI
jgi:ABC-type multidrug transport system fused ATPase/permease subunit